jgi:Right handed beta helix region
MTRRWRPQVARLRILLAAAISAGVFCAQPGLAGAVVTHNASASIYVSPSGNDGNPGTSAQPLQTLSRAQEVVRTLDANMTGDIDVYLEEGTYRLSRPLQLRPQDSGTNGHDVVWTSTPGASAVIGGADQISGWQLSNPAKDIWAASVPPDLRTRQIYVNGTRADLASGPPPVKLARTGSGYKAASPLMARWKNPSEIDFVYPTQLGGPVEPICPVASIKDRYITMAQLCWNNSNQRGNTIVGWAGALRTPTYIENAYQLLTQPGQFYLDDGAHMLYYIPRYGQDMQTADVEAPALQALVQGAGSAAQPVHNITFSNLQFSYATWMQPSSPEGFSEQQAGYTITGKHGYATEGLCRLVPHGTCPYGAWTKEPGNIQFSYDRDISFINDRFVHLGAAGLNLDNGSQNDTIEGSSFTDISGNGLEIGSVNMPQATGSSQTTNLTVIDNHLYGLPAEYHGGVAILAGYVANTTISHNQIDHTPCAAISFGWGGWLDKRGLPPVPNFSHDNTISDNLIFDYMLVLSDGGGVYTQGIQGSSMATGLKVEGNVIHDQLDWGGALKADDGTTYITYAKNVLYNNTYDWDGMHLDFRTRPGKPAHTFAPELLKNNWWQQGMPNGSNKGVILSGNKIVTGPEQAPSSILSNAGLQPGFRSLLLWQPEGDAVPNSPEQVSVMYAFRGKAYVTWHPSYAEGSSPIASYTLRVCRAKSADDPTACGQTSGSNTILPSLAVPASDLDQLGYAVISGLTVGKRYAVTVTANNAQGSSIPSLPSAFTPRANAPGLPGKPTQLYVQTAPGIVRLLWYRPKNDRRVILLTAPNGRHPSKPRTRSSTTQHLFVLSYYVTASSGGHVVGRYAVTGHEPLVQTNIGSWVLKVIGGLNPHHRYRFSVAASNPTGIGPATRTGWITPGS